MDIVYKLGPTGMWEEGEFSSHLVELEPASLRSYPWTPPPGEARPPYHMFPAPRRALYIDNHQVAMRPEA